MADPICEVLQAAVRDGLTPGCAAAVVDADGHVDRFCTGTLAADDASSTRHVVDEDTVYDTASLTKLLVTATLVADAIDDGVMELDETPWPRWPGLTVEHALAHSGGLPAHRPFFEALRADPERSHLLGRQEGRDIILDAVHGTEPDTAPGERVVYSDLGFIALGALVEARRQQRLDALWLAHPSSRQTTARFVSLQDDGYHRALPRVAPTEYCPWRRRFVQGQVHDDNAFAMGGVGGHAGLFASLNDVCVLAQGLLARLRTPGDTLGTFAGYRTLSHPLRGLAFDVATPGGSTGDALGPRTVGHLGFTGTSLWLDPDAGDGGRAFVLLANTVHLGRESTLARNRALRVAFHRAAARG
jgi:CubicO group peptidase (beta-lactamase class C family)